MNTRLRRLPIALVMLALAPLPALADGRVIFASGDVSLVGQDGARRPARKGDHVQPGERVVTAPNAMAQLKLRDGAFVGVRPGSSVKLQAFGAMGAGAELLLQAGSVRVLNLETNGSSKPLPVQLQSADGARVLVRGADLESGKPAGSTPAAGLLTRVSAGTALAQTTQGDRVLALHNVNSVTPTAVGSAPSLALPPIVIKNAALPAAPATPPGATSGALPGAAGYANRLVGAQPLGAPGHAIARARTRGAL